MLKLPVSSVLIVVFIILSPCVKADIQGEIIVRCQKQMKEYGAAIVKACVDQDIEAAAALSSYLDKHRPIVVRCYEEMMSYGWAVVKACVDQDVEAEKSLGNYSGIGSPSANKFFVEALQILSEAKAETDFIKKYIGLNKVAQMLKVLIEKFPESDIAVKIVTRQPIGAFDPGSLSIELESMRMNLASVICKINIEPDCLLRVLETLVTKIYAHHESIELMMSDYIRAATYAGRYDLAREIAASIKYEGLRYKTLAEIMRLEIASGSTVSNHVQKNLDDLHRSISRFAEGKSKNQKYSQKVDALLDVALAYAQTRRFDKTYSILSSLPRPLPDLANISYAEVLSYLIEHGELKMSEQLLNSENNGLVMLYINKAKVVWLLKRDNIDEARINLQKYYDREDYCFLSSVARNLEKTLKEKIKNIYMTFDFQKTKESYKFLNCLADVRAIVGDMAGAREAIKTALSLIENADKNQLPNIRWMIASSAFYVHADDVAWQFVERSKDESVEIMFLLCYIKEKSTEGSLKLAQNAAQRIIPKIMKEEAVWQIRELTALLESLSTTTTRACPTGYPF